MTILPYQLPATNKGRRVKRIFGDRFRYMDGIGILRIFRAIHGTITARLLNPVKGNHIFTLYYKVH